MFERFTDRARNVLVLAQGQATVLGHNYIGTEHLLLGMALEGTGVAARVLSSYELTPEVIRARVEELTVPGLAPGGRQVKKPPFTPLAKRSLETALREALNLGHNYIGTEHLLLGVSMQAEGMAARILADAGAGPTALHERVMVTLRGYSASAGGTATNPGGPERPAPAASGVRRRRGVTDEFVPSDIVPAQPYADAPSMLTPALQLILTEARAAADPDGPITSTDVLRAMVDTPDSHAGRVLQTFGIDPEPLASRIQLVSVEGTSDAPEPPEVSITVGDQTRVIDDAGLASFLARATPEEIREALRRGLDQAG